MPSPTCTVTLPLSQARAESDPTLARPWDRTGHQHRPLCPGGCPAPVALCWKLPIPPSPGPDEDMEAAGTRPLTTGPLLAVHVCVCTCTNARTMYTRAQCTHRHTVHTHSAHVCTHAHTITLPITTERPLSTTAPLLICATAELPARAPRGSLTPSSSLQPRPPPLGGS